MRRASYKGSVQTTRALPVDATTTMGIILVLGTILAARGLTPEALRQCAEIMQSLCEQATFHGPLLLIPEQLSLSLQSARGKVHKKDLVQLLKDIHVDPVRWELTDFPCNSSNSTWVFLFIFIVSTNKLNAWVEVAGCYGNCPMQHLMRYLCPIS